MAARKPATTKEKLFYLSVKSLPCVICGAPPYSEAHHICDRGRRLGNMFCISLCVNCHRGDDGFSGKNRKAWDKSLQNQLFLLTRTYKMLGLKPPVYKSKIVRRNAE